MYIQISPNQEAPVSISRKLHKALGFDNSQNPCGAISISQIKGTNQFVIVKRTPEETFQTQCSLVTPHPKRSKKTPSVFHFTIPSLEFIKTIAGFDIHNGKIIKVKPIQLKNGATIYRLDV